MKNLFILLLFGTLSFSVSAQKNKNSFNEDTLLVNGAPLAIIDKKGGFSADFRVKSLDGKDLINFHFNEFNNPDKINASNPQGRVTYYEITFLDEKGGKCEEQIMSSKKAIAKVLIENSLIEGNGLNDTAVKNYIAINGLKFSEEKASLRGPKVIIIER